MGRQVSKYKADEVRRAVAESLSIAGTLRLLKIRVAGGNYDTIKRAISELRLDTSHWTGQGHRKGSRIPVVPPRPLSQLLVRGIWVQTHKLRKRLIREGALEFRCSACGLDTWRDQPISLELDHIDGDRTNHELGNLRLLCPNCHAQTSTYRGRNIKIGRR